MGILLFDFVIQLKDNSNPYPLNHNGPLFHKWLPDGEKDAIILNTGDPQAELKVSFERRGFVNDSGYIVFKLDRHDVDPEVIPRQAVLEGGHLIGWLKIEGITEEEIENLQKATTGDAIYEALGKRVINLIYPPISKLIDLLRTNYGQYWLRELDKWDSRSQSLGSYCAGLGISWSLDAGKTWSSFVPTKRVSTNSLTISLPSDEDFRRELLTSDDWQELPTVVNSDYEPSPAAVVVTRAYQLLDQGHLRQAFIEGVTALEVALDDYIKQQRGGSKMLAGYIEQFQSLPLQSKIATIAVISGLIPAQDVEDTIAAYKVRNLIVHDGAHPSDDDEYKLSALLRAAASLITGPKFRFITTHTKNALEPK
ncbi:MAG: hypothetical protein M3362_02350 [Acidobacteriota bacterium]|nr:hypothetical protein [Acidobacteriota bacterium]